MGGAAGTDDQSRADVGHQVGSQLGIGDGLLHGHPRVGMAIGHEAHQLAIDERLNV